MESYESVIESFMQTDLIEYIKLSILEFCENHDLSLGKKEDKNSQLV